MYAVLPFSRFCINQNRNLTFDVPYKDKYHIYIMLHIESLTGVRTPPHRDDLRFSNTTGILPKKLCGLLVLKQSKRRVHPLLKKSWIRPWNFDITKGQGTGKFYSLQQIFFISRSFDYYWGRENRLLYRGLRYIEVCYHSRFELVTSSFDIMQIKKLQYFMFIMKINFTIYMVYHVETSIFENFQILHRSKYGTFDIWRSQWIQIPFFALCSI